MPKSVDQAKRIIALAEHEKDRKLALFGQAATKRRSDEALALRIEKFKIEYHALCTSPREEPIAASSAKDMFSFLAHLGKMVEQAHKDVAISVHEEERLKEDFLLARKRHDILENWKMRLMMAEAKKEAKAEAKAHDDLAGRMVLGQEPWL